MHVVAKPNNFVLKQTVLKLHKLNRDCLVITEHIYKAFQNSLYTYTNNTFYNFLPQSKQNNQFEFINSGRDIRNCHKPNSYPQPTNLTITISRIYKTLKIWAGLQLQGHLPKPSKPGKSQRYEKHYSLSRKKANNLPEEISHKSNSIFQCPFLLLPTKVSSKEKRTNGKNIENEQLKCVRI